jgi:hypothetical protein
MARQGWTWTGMTEVWRTIPESPYFAVSNLGRVQYLVSGEIMEVHVDTEGDDVYLGVNLIDEGGNEFCAPIECLVVDAFIQPAAYLEIVKHRDGDPWNNEVWNLEVDEDARDACLNCE